MEQQTLHQQTTVRQIKGRLASGETPSLVLAVLLGKQSTLQIPKGHVGFLAQLIAMWKKTTVKLVSSSKDHRSALVCQEFK